MFPCRIKIKTKKRGKGMENENSFQGADKINRILHLYSKIMDGEIVNKADMAKKFGVNERSIQRDIEDIRNFLHDNWIEEGVQYSIIYDRERKGYCLEKATQMKISNSELIAISKILLDSRAFVKEEMQSILERLIRCSAPVESQKVIKEICLSEMYHYVEPRHGVNVESMLWNIALAVQHNKYMEITYQRTKDKKLVNRKIKPVAIIFSEYYFYLTAFIDEKDESRTHFDVENDVFPTIYRIDRIKEFAVLDEHFFIPYKDRFEEGEFRKRIQFMYGGMLQKVKFKYSGSDVDAILDRLPTAKILDELEDGYIISAEVFGKGIDMWLRSQGDVVKMISQ